MNDDQIIIEGLRCYGYHGVNPEERVLGQRFLVDVTIEADLREAGRTDDLARTISYSDAARRARTIVEGEARNLLEAVAEAVATDLLTAYPNATAVTVTLRKPEAPVKGVFFDAVGAWIKRTREDAP